MSVVLVDEDNSVKMDLPINVSYVHIKDDGAIEDSLEAHADVFIEEDQVAKLQDKEICGYLRNNFSGIVGIIHRRLSDIEVPKGNSVMFVLGG